MPSAARATGLSLATAIGTSLLGGATPLVIAALLSRAGDALSPACCLAAASAVGVLAAFGLPDDATDGDRVISTGTADLRVRRPLSPWRRVFPRVPAPGGSTVVTSTLLRVTEGGADAPFGSSFPADHPNGTTPRVPGAAFISTWQSRSALT